MVRGLLRTRGAGVLTWIQIREQFGMRIDTRRQTPLIRSGTCHENLSYTHSPYRAIYVV
ncbi:hypothetical protein PISMIDRAFT_689432, partial [Pisolithus microcarpus 441]